MYYTTTSTTSTAWAANYFGNQTTTTAGESSIYNVWPSYVDEFNRLDYIQDKWRASQKKKAQPKIDRDELMEFL